jgi:oligopeptide/dipeptide ABC transporter ATP-binding protein
VSAAEVGTDQVGTLQAVGVSKRYARGRHSSLHALDGVDLELRTGEIVGLVGESGSGKSTLAGVLVGGVSPTGGQVLLDGRAVTAHRDRSMRRRVQMVFQDPYSSLNPRMTVRSVLSELIRVHRIVEPSGIDAELSRVMKLVGLDEQALDAFPRQFSGGQRQRVAIARALVVRPEILIADEPVSALDVSIQATILELFESLRSELGLSILFVAHNLAVVQHVVDRIAVMYLGRIVETAPTRQLFDSPQHPYTQALIASVPRMTPGGTHSEYRTIEGEPPSPINLPSGCRFRARCPYAQPRCAEEDPQLAEIASDHDVACWYAGRLSTRNPTDGGAPST